MVQAIKCYVCGPASGDAFPTTTESTSSALSSSELNAKALNQMRPCEEFDASANKTGFERDCPENFHGCITQIEGTESTYICIAVDKMSKEQFIFQVPLSVDLVNL